MFPAIPTLPVLNEDLIEGIYIAHSTHKGNSGTKGEQDQPHKSWLDTEETHYQGKSLNHTGQYREHKIALSVF